MLPGPLTPSSGGRKRDQHALRHPRTWPEPPFSSSPPREMRRGGFTGLILSHHSGSLIVRGLFWFLGAEIPQDAQRVRHSVWITSIITPLFAPHRPLMSSLHWLPEPDKSKRRGDDVK